MRSILMNNQWKRGRNILNSHKNTVCKMFICFFIFLISFGYHSQLAVSASEHMKLEDELEHYIKKHDASIAGLSMIVVDKDETIIKMNGYANLEKQIPVNEHTVFEWGSVSKILIWISVLQLVEKGKMDLETNIEAYLPDDFLSKSKIEKPITMHHLMHHTAGFDDSYTDLMVQSPAQKKTLRTVLEAADIKQVFSPGDLVAYSNYGSGLAAYIVEEISGLDYREYVRKNIFEPLHMTKTAIDSELEDNIWVKEQREKIQGYSNTLELIEPNFYLIPLYPTGSVTGTAGDLQKLLQALLTEDGTPLFKYKKTIDFMFEPTIYYPGTNIPRNANGLFYLPSKSQNVYGHGGNSKAFSSSFYLDRKAHLGVVVLTNIQYESVFTQGIPEIIFGKYTHMKNKMNLENSTQWEGIYEPARLPRHGFSKIYGLFLRSKTKSSELHHLKTNDLSYSQLEPSIYQTEDEFNLFSLDVYSKHPEHKKILSNTYSDLLYIPNYKHYLEWGVVILGLLAVLFSFIYLIVSLWKRIAKKGQLHSFVFAQQLLNLCLFVNLIWIIYKAASMASYSDLRPFLLINLFYMVATFINSGLLLNKIRNKKLTLNQKAVWWTTILFALILCSNLFYWEFYY